MGSAASLVLYITLFILSVLFVYWGNKKRATGLKLALGSRHFVIKPLLIMAAAIPVLISGFRQGVGTDFNNYVIEYNAATQSGSYLEIGFNVIASFSASVFGSPTFMFIAFSALTVIPVMMALNKSNIIRKEYRWIFWMLFIFIMFPQTFNLLRQGVAVAIGFYLIISVIENRRLLKISHLLLLLLAVSFHASAWILAPILLIAYLLNNTRRASIIKFTVISTAFAIALFGIIPQILDLLGGTWAGYLDSTAVSRSVLPRSAMILLILMLCWKFYDALKISNSYTALLWVGLLFSFGGLFIAYFERAGYYITLLLPLLVLVKIIQSVPRAQSTAVNAFTCIFALAYFVGVYYLMGSSDIFPYNWSF